LKKRFAVNGVDFYIASIVCFEFKKLREDTHVIGDRRIIACRDGLASDATTVCRFARGETK
jgi:hypothetical protein